MLDKLNEISAAWADVIIYATISGTIAIAVVGAFNWLMYQQSHPAWARNWLWRLVAFKLLLAALALKPIPVPVLSPLDLSTVRKSTAEVTQIVPGSQAKAIQPRTQASQQSTANSNFVAIAKTKFARSPQPLPEAAMTLPSWQSWLMLVWCLGVVASLAVFARQLLCVARIQVQPVNDPQLLAAAKELAEQQNVPQLPIGVSDQASSPLLVGFFKPTIVFDDRTLRECTMEQKQSVISHELAHYRRGDLWWNLLPAIVHVIYFFHPLVWFANHRYRITSEMACDALAIQGAKQTPAQYAASLLQVSTFGSDRVQSQRLLGAVAVFHSSRSLKQRMYAMKDSRVLSKRRAALIACAVLLVGLLGVVPWQPVHRAMAADPAESYGDNMGFDEKADSGQAAKWYGGGEGYKLRTDKSEARSGGLCALIKGSSESGFGTYTQCMDAKPLQGKRIAFSGYLKSELKENGEGGLWFRVDKDDQSVSFDNMADRRVKGKTDWTKHEIVLDVPEDATRICFGFLMTGKGKLYADDLEIKPTDKDAKKTDAYMEKLNQGPKTLVNGGFETESDTSRLIAANWGGGSGDGYKRSRDTDVKHSGKASARIKGTKKGDAFASVTQGFLADDFRGKRLELTAYVKTKDMGHAGLWMRVDGKDGESTAFDNMGNRPIKGTTDWTKYSVVLDVDKEARFITLGCLAAGTGSCWCDDFELTVHEQKDGPKTTGLTNLPERKEDLQNGDFEEPANGKKKIAMHWGGGGEGYKLERDESVKHSGNASGRIEKVAQQGFFGTYTQMFPAKKFHGKRVRLTGYMKSEDAKQSGLWLRVDGPNKKPLGFDNMSTRPVKDTTDWTKHEVILDVPKSATFLAMGFLLSGEGTVWADDLKLEVVGELGEGPEVTNMLPPKD